MTYKPSCAARAAEDIRREHAIRETVAQDWPRCGGDRIDPAEAWVQGRFTDAEVVAWLEVGVPRAAAAVRLADAGVEPREVGGEFDTDVTLGLAFTRGEVSTDRVLELRRGAREDRCTGISASWCPRCGDCKCPEREEFAGDMDAPDCPLHALNSTHGDDAEVE